MPALQIRDVPEDIYVQYKQRCAEEDRSMAQQTLRLIKKYLNDGASTPVYSVARHQIDPIYSPHRDEIGRQERIEKRKALFERMDRLGLDSIQVPDRYPSAVEMIREDRDNDHGHVYSWEAK